MRAILEILSGVDAPRRVRLEAGKTMRVGRGERADVRIATDTQLSGVHFEVAFDGETCTVRDLGSAKGTLLEGDTIHERAARDGDTVIAGETWLRVRIRPENARIPGGEDRLDEKKAKALLGTMHQRGGRLYALLDAARDPRILVLLRETEDEYRSLYEGMSAQTMSEEAPYLVELLDDSWLGEAILREGFGRSWGVFVTSKRPLADVRKHLRQFLFVRDEADRELYFRFYDPRVLRNFLPTCSVRQIGQIFEGIDAYWVEAERGRGLQGFTMNSTYAVDVNEFLLASIAEES
jgi:pSer/pThr/pTyr-binding forkhead associated (FHA) protein